jgi:acyl-CoA thioester hydrolase
LIDPPAGNEYSSKRKTLSVSKNLNLKSDAAVQENATGLEEIQYLRMNSRLFAESALIHPPLRLPLPFTSTRQVVPEEIDEYAHVNNAVYLQWLDYIAWTHSAVLGMPLASCLALRRGMAVRHTRIDYLEAALLGDALLLATWLVACDGRLRCTRRFEILRLSDGKRVADAEIEYFCMNLDTGKPCRFPPEFVGCYTVIPEVAAAYEKLPDDLHRVGYSRRAG